MKWVRIKRKVWVKLNSDVKNLNLIRRLKTYNL